MSDNDPLDALRRADPQRTDPDSAARLARIRVRVIQEISMDTQTSRQPRFGRPAIGAAAAALAAAIVLVIIVMPRGVAPGTTTGSPAPSSHPVAAVQHSPTAPVPSPSEAPTVPVGGPVSGSCVQQYSLATLGTRSIAFDGTVSSLRGNDVEFTVNRAFRGVTGSTITLTAEGMTGTTVTSAGGPTLVVGQRYLVAGEDHFAWACGFTQPYDASVAADWAGAFGK